MHTSYICTVQKTCHTCQYSLSGYIVNKLRAYITPDSVKKQVKIGRKLGVTELNVY